MIGQLLPSAAVLRTWIALLVATVSAVPAAGAARPNVVIIVADDLGNHDLGVQGAADLRTPNVDSIASGGVRFTNGYVSCPVCSPTQAGLLTGRNQQRFGHEFNPGPQAAANFGLPLDQSTIADAFKAAGYRTGLVGKWHQGQRDGYRPTQRGFDEFFGFLGGAHAYLPPGQVAKAAADPDDDAQPAAQVVNGNVQTLAGIYRGDKTVEEREYLTDAFGREAVAYVERNQKNPFLLYLAFNAVHLPPHATKKYLDRFPKLEGQRKIYAAQLSALDDAVGQVLGKLRELKLEEDTLIFFVSDNGGPTANGSNNGIFRGTKGTVLEGGVRVPYFVQWKGKLPAGETREQVVSTLDIFPTALAAAGIATPAKKAFDGVDILAAARGEAGSLAGRSLAWRFGPQWAIRDGKWKLTKTGAEDVKLFDLSADPHEDADLTAANPEVVKSLRAKYEAWDKGNAEPLWKPQGQRAGQGPGAGAGGGARRAQKQQQPQPQQQQPQK